MAGSQIKGITIEIDGDVTKLTAALKKVDKEIRRTQSSLRDVNKLLKLDPGNTDLLAQKQKALGEAIDATREKLRQEEEALKQLQAGPQNADTVRQQEALTREIEATRQSLEKLEGEYKAFGSVSVQKHEAEIRKYNDQLKVTKASLKDVNAALKMDPGNVDLLAQKQKYLAQAVEQTKNKLAEQKAQLQALGQVPQTDEVVRKQEQLTREISETSMELKSLTKEYRKFGSVAAQQAANAGDKIQKVGDKMAGVGTKVSMGVTVPIVAGAAKAVSAYGDVEKQFNLVKQTMGETANSAEDFEGLWDQMGTSAKASVFGMQDAADAVLNFARQGFSAKQATDMLTPAMELASGTGTDLSEVTGGLGNTMKSFGASSDEAAEYADVLARAQAQANTTTSQLFESMSTAGSICKTVGWNVKDLATITGVFGDAGISGSEGANALKTGLARLASPAKSGAQSMQELGLSTGQTYAIFNKNGTLKEMPEVMKNLNKAFSGLSQQEQLEAASNIFGKNQMAKWLVLIQSSPEKFSGLRDALDGAAGSATDMSNALMEGTGGTIEQLKSTFDVLTVTIGEALGPALTQAMEKVIDLMNAFMDLNPETQKLILKAAGIAAVVGPMLITVGKMASGVGAILKLAPAIGNMFGVIGKLGGAFSSLFSVMAANPIMLVIAAVAALVLAFIYLWNTSEEFRDFWKNLWKGIRNVVKTVWNGIKTFCTAVWKGIVAAGKAIFNVYLAYWKILWNIVRTVAETVWKAITAALSKAWNGIKDLAATVFGGIGEFFIGIWNGISSAASSAWKGVTNVLSGAWNGIVKLASTVFGGLGKFFSGIWSGISTAAGTAWKGIKTLLSGIWNGIKEKASAVFGGVKDAIGNVWGKVKTKASESWKTVSTLLSGKWKTIRENAGNVFENVKSVIAGKWKSVKENTSSVWEGIKATVKNKGGGIRGVMGTLMEGYKNVWKSGFSFINQLTGGRLTGVLSVVRSKMGSVKNAFAGAMENAKAVVNNGLSRIRGFFSRCRLQLPKIKLPHFSLKGKFSLKPPPVPKISVKWYKKAYEDAMLFSSPTVLPTPGGLKGFGDGNGSELVVGTNKLMNMIADASGSDAAAQAVQTLGAQILNLMQQYFPQMAEGQVVLDSGTLVGSIAPKMNRQLGIIAGRKMRG